VRIAWATDEVTAITEAVRAALVHAGHDVADLGPGVAWPVAGRVVGEAVAAERADAGVVWCWTGTGVAMAAGKVRGVRAALCVDAETARGARRWNDANVCALSLRLTTVALAEEILGAFLTTAVESDEAANIAALEATEVTL